MRASSPAPLPGSASTVDDDAPLTTAQAAQVRAHGRALTQAMIDLIARAVQLAPEGDVSTEEWAGCCAVSDSLSYGTHYNGVLYSSDITFAPATGLDSEQLHRILAAAEISWYDDDPCVGTVGVFRISVDTTAALRIGVTSPCYFIRELTDADGGTLPADDIAAVTGFLNRGWAE